MMSYRTAASGFVYGADKFGTRVVETFKKQNKKTEFSDILRVNSDKQVIVYYNFSQELEDIKEVAFDILRHRLGLSFEAEAENLTADNLVEQLLNNVEIP